MIGIGESIALVKGGFDIAKAIRTELKKEKPDPHLISQHLIELQEVLLTSQQALSEADRAIHELQAKLERRNALDEDKAWETGGSFYRKKSDVEAGRDIPYCPICWDTTDTAVPMAPHTQPGTFKCGLHDPVYRTPYHDKWVKDRDARLKAVNQRRIQGDL